MGVLPLLLQREKGVEVVRHPSPAAAASSGGACHPVDIISESGAAGNPSSGTVTTSGDNRRGTADDDQLQEREEICLCDDSKETLVSNPLPQVRLVWTCPCLNRFDLVEGLSVQKHNGFLPSPELNVREQRARPNKISHVQVLSERDREHEAHMYCDGVHGGEFGECSIYGVSTYC